ncbi:response regulator [Permianibacter sp. IMCC34836]|uniref:hybrid sensor histidine kinase/response regulator n=1 Tax=Permianibacter fluminis TaxID=2738515 RepID=UPI0015580DDD|nr:response regulator [Permianibacter fluminis]NQD36157.1 response regulator [Permianibacter fluminis]
MNSLLRRSLATKTLLWVLLTSAVLTGITTWLTVERERSRMIEAARIEARNAVNGSVSAMAGAVWAYDEKTLQAILDGLTLATTIQSVQVDSSDLDLQSARDGDYQKVDARWTVPLLAPDGSRKIGVVEVNESYAKLQQLMSDRLTVLAVTEALKMLILTGMLFVIVNLLITRHLRTLAIEVEQLAADPDLQQVSLPRAPRTRSDELDIVVSAVNQFSLARRTAEVALRELNAELEQRIQDRTLALQRSNEDLAQARDAADAASQAKSTFLANMSHEIRTPLNAIIGMSYLAERTALSVQQRGYIEKTRTAAESLLSIINDILDFSKIEAGKMELEQQPFLLADVIDKITALVAFRAHAKGLEYLLDVSADTPAGLIGDPLRLSQVLLNLCNNAIKFTQQGEVLLRIEPSRLSPNAAMSVRLRFAVRDTGIGLNDVQRSRLFQPFTQADTSTTRQFGGTGLGLAISRQLVELMHGEIGVNSEAGVGSEFWFEADFGLATELQVEAARRLPQAELRLQVLVVDDNQSARVIATNLLDVLGFPCKAVDSGRQALLELQQASQSGRPYDLVLLDWRMPEEDGLSVFKQIRADSQLSVQPKVILFTGSRQDELAEAVDAAGFDGYLSKPATLSGLLDSILTACGKQAVARDALTKEDNGNRWRALRGKRVLLVEDNELNQQLAMEILVVDAGIDVTVARSGREAVDLLRQQPLAFAAVLMDIQMPEMDGYEATRQIRQRLHLTSLPIIAMTAHALQQDRQQCLAVGMNDFISKPFIPDELFETLSCWLRPEANSGAGRQNGVVHQNGVAPQNGAVHHNDSVQHNGSAAGKTDSASNDRNANGAEKNASASGVADPRTDEPAIAGLADLPRLDPVLGRSHCNGKESLYRKVLQLFVDTRAESGDEVASALQQQDWTTATRTAHTVKSVSATLGARRLAFIAGELELALANRNAEKVPVLLQAFREELSAMLQQSRDYLASEVS